MERKDNPAERQPTMSERKAVKAVQRASQNPELADHMVVNEQALLVYDGLGTTVRNEMIAAGQYPAPIKVGKRAKRWLLREVLAWQEERKQLRDVERAGGAK